MIEPVRRRIDRGIRVRSGGIYALSSWREMAYHAAPRLLLIAGLLALPLLLEPTWHRLLCRAAVIALLAVSFDFLAHHVGLVSLGGALFAGTGGYIAGTLNLKYGLPPVLGIPIATVAGAAVCTAMLWPGCRLRGVYFAFLTMLLPLFMRRMTVSMDVFGGARGLSNITPLSSPWLESYLPVVAVLAAVFALRRLVTSDTGVLLRAIRDDESAVRASGIDPTPWKAGAVFVAAVMGCFAGAYMSHLYRWTGQSMFILELTILPIAATVVGGPSTLVGPVVGSYVLSPLSELMFQFGSFKVVVYSALILVFVLRGRGGLMQAVVRHYHRFQRGGAR